MKKFFLPALCALVLSSCGGNEDHSIELSSTADLAGLRVGVASGSCYDMELSARDDIILQRYNTESDILQALINDKVDVSVTDEVIFNVETQRENDIKIALVGKDSYPTGFMFPKNKPELAQAMTDTQQRLEADGTMERLKDFWLTDRYVQEDHFTHIPPETGGKPIRVACCSMFAPIGFQVNGDWYGLEIDLLRELGKDLHRPLEIKLYDVSSGILAIKTGMADVLCGCIFITPERKEEFLFSVHYHDYHPAYFVVDREAAREHSGLWTWFKKSVRKNLLAENRWKFITRGLWETLKISILAILMGSLLGIILYQMGRSRSGWLRTIATVYNGFIAGIPELVLLLINFYIIFAKTTVPPDLVAVVTFSLFFASGASDIYQTSLSAVPHGQTEAGLALGFTPVQTFFHIVFPQAIRHGLPLYRGQCVSLLKGTSIVGYIAIQDLTRAGDIIRSRTFDAVLPLLTVTIIYFLLVLLIGNLLRLAKPKKKVL